MVRPQMVKRNAKRLLFFTTMLMGLDFYVSLPETEKVLICNITVILHSRWAGIREALRGIGSSLRELSRAAVACCAATKCTATLSGRRSGGVLRCVRSSLRKTFRMDLRDVINFSQRWLDDLV